LNSFVTEFVLEECLVAVIGGMLLMVEGGRRLAIHRPPSTSTGSSTIVASCFGLMSLLLAFTFYGAAARFDLRRDLIVQEANAIETAYRRLDLLPREMQARVKEMFRQYVATRLETYQKISDPEGFKDALDRTVVLQNEIWQEAVAGGQATGTTTAHVLLLPSITQMFDFAATRNLFLEAHPPYTVIILLVLTVMVSSLLAGYELSAPGRHSWLYKASYILVLSAALVVIADYEYPRLGLDHISRYDKVIAQTLDHMK
jgi:hypothetical protein